jgi:rhodanese-related sulfurtransferase
MQDFSAKRLSAARNFVPRIAAADAARLVGQSNVVFLDVRDFSEIEETGKIKGAINIPRDLLSFSADPKSPFYVYELGLEKTVIVYSLTGRRSASACATLKQLGFVDVKDMGAFEYWKRGGGAVEYLDEHSMILQRV